MTETQSRLKIALSFSCQVFDSNQTVRETTSVSYFSLSSVLLLMASCSYSSILKEKSSPCGSNWKNPENFSCVTLRDCNLDVASHLKSCKVADNRIENEVQLLLARAGTVLPFIIVFSDFSIDL